MGSFWLEFEQGGQVQQANFETSSISLGRDRNSDFVLDHPTVSRQHALIVHQGGDVFELVVMSRGGLTAIDGQPVQQQEVRLYDGMAITLGKYTVTFRSHQAPKKSGGQGGSMGGGGYQQMGGGSKQGQMGGSMMSSAGSSSSGGGMDSIGGDTDWESIAAQDEEEPEEKKGARDKGADIMSWDEIAASSSEDDEDGEMRPDLKRLRDGGGQDEESNPIIIFGALGAAAVMLFFAVFAGGGGGDDAGDGGSRFSDMPPVEVSVSCLDEVDCRDNAIEAYEQGVDLLERRAVERSNLFNGYEQLMKAEAYLEEGGIGDFPSEMDDWQALHDDARESLDSQFAEYRVRYHQAQTRQRYSEMAEVLDDIKTFFPERNARENWWARQQERRMKSEGIYPSR